MWNIYSAKDQQAGRLWHALQPGDGGPCCQAGSFCPAQGGHVRAAFTCAGSNSVQYLDAHSSSSSTTSLRFGARGGGGGMLPPWGTDRAPEAMLTDKIAEACRGQAWRTACEGPGDGATRQTWKMEREIIFGVAPRAEGSATKGGDTALHALQLQGLAESPACVAHRGSSLQPQRCVESSVNVTENQNQEVKGNKSRSRYSDSAGRLQRHSTHAETLGALLCRLGVCVVL